MMLADLTQQQCFRIEESSGVGVVRRYALRLAEALGFGATAAGELAIVVTEAATNIVKHAGAGELLLRPLRGDGGNGIEVLALDRGPGIADIAASMCDGISTLGTGGSGLGAMRRLATEFDVYTAVGAGTVFYLSVWADAALGASWAPLGVVSLPKPGEEECGDGWNFVSHGEHALLAIADGLGHGPEAATAARAVLGAMRAPELSPTQLLELAHRLGRTTRGAALAFAALQMSTPSLRFAGVGNIAASVVSDERRQQLISHNGIVGHNLRKMQEVAIELSVDMLLVMHSDGLSTQWNLQAYPGLSTRHPAVIAAVLYRDFARKTDDVTVLVLRYKPRVGGVRNPT